MKLIQHNLPFIAGFFLIGTILLTGCDNTSDPKPNLPDPEEVRKQAEQDSLQWVSQSQPELMLADRAFYEDSILVFDLSKEEAEQLMIPEELYDNYSAYVERVNK